MNDLVQLFLVSVLVSAATFGGGAQALFYQYGVLQTHWITRTDLSAVLAFGYATPGPAVFGTATFIGYRVAGLSGALVGTIGTTVVPFVGSLLAARYMTRLMNHPHAALFTKGVGLAASGLVAATAFSVLHIGSAPLWQLGIAAVSFGVSCKWKLNPLFILLAGALLGLLF
jgi:chromate transporter